MEKGQTGTARQPIAVVGVSCRLPGGVRGLDELWEALAEGRDLVGEIPEDRFETDRFVDTAVPRPGKSYTRAGGFLDDVAGFDAAYFGIAPTEAEQMDPQHRLLLELTAEAMDDAAIAPERLAGSDAAVYVGISDASYGVLQVSSVRGITPYTMSGAASSIAANRLSHAFDLRGPSMAVDTACSSSLVALDRACRTLWDGTSRVAVCGGANMLLSPHQYIGFSQASMLSPRGRCASFSADADGFVRAEGGGVVLLKPLAEALADGDRVHGVILGTAANSDGRTLGIALPNEQAQEDLLREAYAAAGVHPDELVYFEAHGTGTAMGDPLEALAIGRALGIRRIDGALPIGSVKSNLGHLEPASGMAGLCKALLVLKHRTAPASLHAEQPHPDIDFDGLGLSLTAGQRALPAVERPVVGVNSFGFGGANAHAILAAAPERTAARLPRAGGVPAQGERVPEGPLPVLVSARTREALAQAAARTAERLAGAGEDEFYDLAYTSCVRRGRHEHRAAVLAGTAAEAAGALEALAGQTGPEGQAQPVEGGTELAAAPDDTPAAPVAPASDAVSARVTGVARGRVAFVFSGNGSQWAGMGADLLEHDPEFRDAVRLFDTELTPLLGWSVAENLAAPPESWRLAATEVAQPLLCAVQLGIVASLRARGVEPAMVLGHSVGEVAAAYTGGALSLAQTARVIAERSRAQAATAGAGRMAAVGLGAAQAADELAPYDGRLEVAGVNSATDVTVAGDAEALAEFGGQLAGRGVFFRELDLDYAFHSRAMDGQREELAGALAGLEPSRLALPYYSTVTGGRALGSELDADYWWHNVRRPVRFSAAAGKALDDGADVFLEIGPHPVLRGYLRRIAAERPGERVAELPTLHRDGDGPRELRTACAALIAAAGGPALSRYFPVPGRVTDLPAYPWQRQRHWNGTPQSWVRSSGNGHLQHPLLGERLPAPQPVWEGTVEPVLAPWLTDHRVGGSVVVPATAYVELAMAAGRAALGTPVETEHLDISNALVVPWPDAGGVRVQTSLNSDDGTVCVTSTTEQSEEPRPHVRARVRTLLRPRPAPLDPDVLREECQNELDVPQFYASCASVGLTYGPAFQPLVAIRTGESTALARYRHEAPGDPYTVHPALLDGALQTGVALLLDRLTDGYAYLPAVLRAVRVWESPATEGLMLVRERSRTADEVCWDILLTDEAGNVTAEIEGCRLRRVQAAQRTPLITLRTELRAAPRPELPCAPSPLPPSGQLLAEAGERIAELRSNWRELRYEETAPLVQRLVAYRHGAAFAALLDDPAEPFGPDDLVAAGMPEQCRRQVALLAPMLERHGVWTAEADGRRRLTGDSFPTEPLALELASEHPSAVINLALALHQLRLLEGLPGGAEDPMELLVSDATAKMLEQFYDVSPILLFHNRLMQTLVTRVVRGWPADRTLRVLEIGAGTGGTTASLLPVLPADRTRYCLTDVSALFLTRAESRFADHDFVDFRTFDLNAEPEEQDFPPGGFDLVIASNALHAAADLGAALRRVRRLLAPGGRLIGFESHDVEVLAPYFGALDSFYANTDTELRPDSVLLERDKWPEALAGAGFTDVVRTGDDEAPLRDEFSVFMATAPPEPESGQDATAEPRPVALPAPRTGTAFVVAAENGEQPLARALSDALADRSAAPVRTVGTDVPDHQQLLLPEGVDGLPAEAGTVSVVLLLGDGDEQHADGASVSRAVRCTAFLRALASASTLLPEGVSAELWLVTRPCGAVPTPEEITHPADAAVWGASRALVNEHPELAGRRLSLHRSDDPALDAERLVRELLDPTEEDEIVLTAHDRFVPRERELPAGLLPAGDRPFTLSVRNPGLNYGLVWAEMPAVPEPGPGEVLVRVRAAGLNYRDIMQSVGLLPAEMVEGTPWAAGTGLECAGVVVACGPDVTDFAPGDRVAGSAPAALSSHVVMRQHTLLRIADTVPFAAATTTPVALTTVLYGLGEMARVRAGETVLVHGAAGGVGLAALYYALSKGARPIATAGSEIKRNFLRGLGIEHVLDSRTLDFAEQVWEITDGQGVDIVLNSLAGEAMARGLELLRSGGRFVELGKRDFFENKPLLLRPFQKNLAFFGLDISEIPEDDPVVDRLCEERDTLMSAGHAVHVPYAAFPAARVDEAFRLLQHSRQIGKVVVTFDPADEPLYVEERARPPRLDPAGSYLVTGGTGGFGAATARWLVELGARNIALVSRRGPAAPEAAELLKRLAERGVRATAYAADVTDRDAMRQVLDKTEAEHGPLRGVVHAAMHLDDGPLTELTDEQLASVLAPKLGGAEVLDELVRERGSELDLFLLHSSGTSTVGSFKQVPYVAANMYLEALARKRRQEGECATAVGWGAVADTGYVARNDLGAYMDSIGIRPVTSQEAFRAGERLLRTGTGVAAVGRLDWAQMSGLTPLLKSARLRGLAPTGGSDGLSREELLSRLGSMSADEATAYLTGTLTELLAEVLHMEAGQLDPHRRLDEYGMDSLMAAQILVSVNQRYGIDIPPMELLRSNGTIDDFARIIHLRLGLGSRTATGGPAPEAWVPVQASSPEGEEARPAG